MVVSDSPEICQHKLSLRNVGHNHHPGTSSTTEDTNAFVSMSGGIGHNASSSSNCTRGVPVGGNRSLFPGIENILHLKRWRWNYKQCSYSKWLGIVSAWYILEWKCCNEITRHGYL